jgi:hypothetical protein
MLSAKEMSDRLELQDLMIRYSEALDRREFDELDDLFVEDAYIDYRVTGGIDGQYPQIKAWLAETLPKFFEVTAHMLGLPAIKLAGDTATARTFCFNPMLFTGENPKVMQVGVWYSDEMVRVDGRWRFARRVEVLCYNKIL